MRYFGSSVRKITSVLIRPGSVVRVHNGPPIITFPHQKVETFFEFAITHIPQGERSELWPRAFPTK